MYPQSFLTILKIDGKEYICDKYSAFIGDKGQKSWMRFNGIKIERFAFEMLFDGLQPLNDWKEYLLVGDVVERTEQAILSTNEEVELFNKYIANLDGSSILDKMMPELLKIREDRLNTILEQDAFFNGR